MKHPAAFVFATITAALGERVIRSLASTDPSSAALRLFLNHKGMDHPGVHRRDPPLSAKGTGIAARSVYVFLLSAFDDEIVVFSH